MISLEEKMRILKIVEEGTNTARAHSELYKHIKGDPALMKIWKTLWLATDLVSAELRSCTSELSKPLVEVEHREPEALSGMLATEIERLRADVVRDWRAAPGSEDSAASTAAAVPDMLEALRVLAEIPVESFGKESNPDYPLMGWNDHKLKVSHVLAARAAIARATGAA